MIVIRKSLGAICLMVALVTLGAYYFNAADPEAAIPIWLVLDVFIIVSIALTIVINVCDSLKARRDPNAHLRQLPRDVITVVSALALMLFVNNHLLFALPHRTENVALWQFLDPAAVAILSWEGISLLRSRTANG